MPKGVRPGGRKKGTPNKNNVESFREKLGRIGCDPEKWLSDCMDGNISCVACNGAGKSANADGEPVSCKPCKGSGKEKIPMTVRLGAAIRLMDSSQPRLASKTVEKTVRRVALGRMNAMTAEERAEAERVADEARDEGRLDE